MCSWKLDFPRQVDTRRVILPSVAEYDAGNSSRTAPISLSVILACTPAYCDHILRQSFHTFCMQQCAEVLSSNSRSTGSKLASRSLSVASSRHALLTRKAPRWICPLMSLLVGGRASIPALELVYCSTLNWLNVWAVVVDLALAQTHTKYISASTTSWSDKVSVSPKFVRYCTGSHVIAACFVPTLRMQSSPVNIYAIITVLTTGAPSWETACCSGSMCRFSPVPYCCQSSFNPCVWRYGA